jgi:outer membrane protein assembly factor BamE (lipoprotein component of BamABCDE complex)
MRSDPFILAVTALLVGACAAYSGAGLQPGASEAQVLQAMGRPALTFDNPDGTRELIYPRGPMGNETYIARLRGGQVQSIDQVLNDAHFDSMPLGVSEQEVLRELGPPRDAMAYKLSSTHSWDWKYMDTWGYESLFSVTFDAQGRAISKFKQRIERGDHRK